jgi:regulator of protease activity HflC (stomatin/prohibitin superfamily)
MTGIAVIIGIALGFVAYVLLRALMMGFFTVAPNERAVLTSFGRAQRISSATTLDTPLAEDLEHSDRDRYKAQPPDGTTGPEDLRFEGISINDLRKNVNLLNEQMDRECRSSAARYGIILDASLITGIDPPQQIESALAAINTAHNEVSSDISVAQALADQRIEESKRAVEIQTMKASPSPSFSIRSTNRELL